MILSSFPVTCSLFKLSFVFQVFAAPYSLRFPRIDRVRYDKPWHECLDVQCKMRRLMCSNASVDYKCCMSSYVISLISKFTFAAFVELVHSSNGTTQKGKDYGTPQDYKSKRVKSSRLGEKKNVSVVPSHFIQTDVSHIKGETLIFSNMVFCIL